MTKAFAVNNTLITLDLNYNDNISNSTLNKINNYLKRNQVLALFAAARSGNGPQLKLLLERDVSILNVDENLNNALHLAVSNQHIEIIIQCLQHALAKNTLPALLAQRNREGNTALDLAKALQNERIIQLLSQHELTMLLYLIEDDSLTEDQRVVQAEAIILQQNVDVNVDIIPINASPNNLQPVSLLEVAICLERYTVAGLLLYYGAKFSFTKETLKLEWDVMLKLQNAFNSIVRQRGQVLALSNTQLLLLATLCVKANVDKEEVRRRFENYYKTLDEAHEVSNAQAIYYFQPILAITALATQNLHRLANSNSTYRSQLKIYVDPTIDNVSEARLSSSKDVLGCYDRNDHDLYIGASLTPYNEDTDIRATFIHEATHFVANEIYNNNCRPYKKDDTKTAARLNTICSAIKDSYRSSKQRRAAFASLFYQNNYTANQQHSELIARTAQYLSSFDDMTTAREDLKNWISDLEVFYFNTFLLDCNAHFKNRHSALAEDYRKHILEPLASSLKKQEDASAKAGDVLLATLLQEQRNTVSTSSEIVRISMIPNDNRTKAEHEYLVVREKASFKH